MEDKITDAICQIIFKRLPGIGTITKETYRQEIAEVVKMIAEMIEQRAE